MEYLTYQLTVETLEPFRIGSVKDVLDVADNPVATVAGKPVIQGPSLKGAFRAAVEKHLIAQYGSDERMRPCIPTARNTLSPDEEVLIQKKIYREGGACQYTAKVQSKSICPACYLFGAMGLPGFLRVPYLFTGTGITDLYSVRVDRALGTVAEGTNRAYQIMPDGVKFSGTLEVLQEDPRRKWKLGEPRPIGKHIPWFKGDEWLEGWDAKRVLEELIEERLKSIVLLGGFKSKGCGKVKVTATRG